MGYSKRTYYTQLSLSYAWLPAPAADYLVTQKDVVSAINNSIKAYLNHLPQ